MKKLRLFTTLLVLLPLMATAQTNEDVIPREPLPVPPDLEETYQLIPFEDEGVTHSENAKKCGPYLMLEKAERWSDSKVRFRYRLGKNVAKTEDVPVKDLDPTISVGLAVPEVTRIFENGKVRFILKLSGIDRKKACECVFVQDKR